MAILPEDITNAINGTPAPSSLLGGNAWINDELKKNPAPPPVPPSGTATDTPDPFDMTGKDAPSDTPAAPIAPAAHRDGQSPAKEEATGGYTHELFSVTLGDFVKKFKPLEWLIYGYVQKNALSMLFGPSGGGKSFVALDMALHIAAKKLIEDTAQTDTPAGDLGGALAPRLEDVETWHGQTTHGGRVFYVAGEGVNGLRKRALGWLQHYGFSPDAMNNYFRFSEIPLPLDDMDAPPDYVGRWHRMLSELETLRTRCNFAPDLIIYDTLKQNMEGEENSAKESGVVIGHAQELVTGIHTDGNGAAVMFIHHTGWGLDAQRRGRGSSAWRGAMDQEIFCSHGVVTEVPPGHDPIIGDGAPDHEGPRPKLRQKHYAVLDITKCKDDEPQPRRYLERKSISLLDADGFPIPAENNRYETTLILKTPPDDEFSLLEKIKVDGDEEEKPKRKKKDEKDKTQKAEAPKPPAKEDDKPEELDEDAQRLLALTGRDGAPAVRSFSQLRRKGE